MAGWEAALREEPPEVAEMVAAFDERRRALVEGLAELGIETPWPRGAFYAFPRVKHLLDERGPAGFCADLLEAESVAIVPGKGRCARSRVDPHQQSSGAPALEVGRGALAGN